MSINILYKLTWAFVIVAYTLIIGAMLAAIFIHPEESVQKVIIVTPTPTPVENQIPTMINLINQERSRHGAAPVVEDIRLDRSAKRKSCDMLENNYFAHDDLQGLKSWHLFIEEGYHYMYAGENLANFSNDVYYEMYKFTHSPKHEDNIVSSNFTNVGIGICGQYVTQHFGSLQ